MGKILRREFIRKSAGATCGAFLPLSLLSENDRSHLNNTPENRGDIDPFVPNMNWQEMLKNHDLIWKELPQEMKQAPHFGNGLVGSMIWFEGNSLRLQVFRTDVHDHADETYGWTAYSRPRYQIGYFTLAVKGQITSCELRQDIYNAELTGKILTSSGDISIHHLVHYHDDVVYMRIECSGNESVSGWKWNPFEAKGSRGGHPGDARYGQAYAPYNMLHNPEHQLLEMDGIKIGLQDLTHGGDYATAFYESVNGYVSTLLINIENSYPEKGSKGKAKCNLIRAFKNISEDLTKWVHEHRQWWHDYYPQSFVTFPDSAGQSFYWGNVYRMACCTRPDAQYIDTAGMWNSGGPWPYSTHDFNTQTAHFPVYTANRLHLGEALMNSLRRNMNNLTENVVPREWQDDSAYLHLATAYDMKGKRDGDARYSEMLGCLPWLLNNGWLHYRYTMDKELLREVIFPLLKRSVNLYRHLLFTGDDDKLHLPPTFSPELGIFTDCSFDLALLKWGCKKLIEICGILEIDDSLKPEWEKIIYELVDYPVDENGYMIGREKTGPQDHQHMSHLMMIYPLYLENIETGKNKALLKKSVMNYQPAGMVKMAASQSSPAASALGMGNLALQRMNDILYTVNESETLGKNGIYYLSTPCIETSLSYNTCVHDMLLQSWGNKIRVFPALPDSWTDVVFHNLRTEGAFLVSASRKNGKTVFVRIKSIAGEPCIINPSFVEFPKVISKNRPDIEEVEKGCYKITLEKDDEVILYQGDGGDIKIPEIH